MIFKLLHRIRHYYQIRNKKRVHFLHIGKTGGTAIKEAFKNNLITSKNIIILHTHNTTLYDIPEGEKVFFFLRDPISRFISGFYSRQRKGRPRFNNEWSPDEKIAFKNFKTPNELAESLSSKDKNRKLIAEYAMKNIYHVKSSYWDWFVNEEYFSSRVKDILFIGFQENMEDDFNKLVSKLGFEKNIVLPQDNIKAHKNPSDVDLFISNQGKMNLKNWYLQDFQFIKWCINLKNEFNI